jgi:histidyl-tRNA synthetase
MVVNMQDDLMPVYLNVSQKLRKAGINVITNFDQRAVGKQFQLAEKQGIPFCVIIGSEEAAAQKASFKDLRTREQVEVALEDLAEEIKRRLM